MKNKNKKAKRIIIREEYCIGCRICEVHCITQHSVYKDIIKAYKNEEELPESGIVFESRGPVSFAIQCRHCEDASCLYGCLTGTLYRDKKSGRVLFDRDKCVGCWMCVMMCPYGVIKVDVKNGKVASKCDLCIDKEFPVCVENCPNEAIILVDVEGNRIEKK